MSKSAFIEGPWRFADAHAHGMYPNDGSVLILEGDETVCAVYAVAPIKRNQGHRHTNDPKRDARARAIVAIPDMVEALQSAVASFEQFVRLNRIPENTAGLRDARAALAKALGESSLPADGGSAA